MTLTEKLAAYVLRLEHCRANTHRAEDRTLYDSLLTDGAGLLADAVVEGSSPKVALRVEQHERLWGQTWLQDPIYRDAAEAWSAVKDAVRTAI